MFSYFTRYINVIVLSFDLNLLINKSQLTTSFYNSTESTDFADFFVNAVSKTGID
jgi:hypothetical protein